MNPIPDLCGQRDGSGRVVMATEIKALRWWPVSMNAFIAMRQRARPGLPSQYWFPLAFPGNTRLDGDASTLIIISKCSTLVGIRKSLVRGLFILYKNASVGITEVYLARRSAWFIQPNGPQLSEERGEVRVAGDICWLWWMKPSGSLVPFPHSPWVITQSLSPCPAHVTSSGLSGCLPSREGLLLLF